MKTKSIKGFLGYYSINNYGEIYSFRSKRVLKNTLDKTTGYYKICLYSGDKCKNTSIHRLLAEAFIPNPKNKPFINHKNGNRGDNRLSNLEWCTNAENVRFSRGLKTRKSKYKAVYLLDHVISKLSSKRMVKANLEFVLSKYGFNLKVVNEEKK